MFKRDRRNETKKENLLSVDSKIGSRSDINQKYAVHSEIDFVTASGITDGTNKHVYDYVTYISTYIREERKHMKIVRDL